MAKTQSFEAPDDEHDEKPPGFGLRLPIKPPNSLIDLHIVYIEYKLSKHANFVILRPVVVEIWDSGGRTPDDDLDGEALLYFAFVAPL
jgi:hypothetical protein